MSKKLTTEEWITRAQSVHGDKYDYNLVEYVDSKTKVKIICREHGVFLQTPNSHISKYGCASCSHPNKTKTTQEFILDAVKIHGDIYDYNLVVYHSNKVKVPILCNTCNIVFKQTPKDHLRGCGCSNCNKNKKLNTETFIKKADKVHRGVYDYSLVVYKNSQIKIPIGCKKCNTVFHQTPASHLFGRGCKKCSIKTNTLKQTFSLSLFKNKAKKIHGITYCYNQSIYVNSRVSIKIKCNECNELFNQLPFVHLRGNGCSNCSGKKPYTNKTFKQRANKVHNNRYDYSLVDIKNTHTKIGIICPQHNIFKQSPHNHLQGQGCPKCVGRILTTEDWINKARVVHRETYDYSLVKYVKGLIKVKIICEEHGCFKQTPSSHLQGRGCPQCGTNTLTEQNILKLSETLYPNTNSQKYTKLSYKLNNNQVNTHGFYDILINNTHYIEVHGEQHYTPNNYFHSKHKTLTQEQAYNKLRTADKAKVTQALSEGKPLLELSLPFINTKTDEELEELIKDFVNNKLPSRRKTRGNGYSVYLPKP